MKIDIIVLEKEVESAIFDLPVGELEGIPRHGHFIDQDGVIP
jgi:hypothetical protein